MDLNSRLLNEQKDWVDIVLRDYVKRHPAKCSADNAGVLSHPFYMGLSDRYIDNADGKKRIMIVGREATGYGMLCDGTADYDFIVKSCAPKDCEATKNEPKNSQLWATAYLNKQLYKEDTALPDCFCKIKHNGSPFWNLFRLLENNGFVTCWNNVDKVYFSKTGKLTYSAEEFLSKPYERQGEGAAESLLQREIEIASPDAVLFVTGKSYFLSMNTALNIYGQAKPVPVKGEECLVRLESGVTDIPIYWTDHPQSLVSKKFKEQDFIELIINRINC